MTLPMTAVMAVHIDSNHRLENTLAIVDHLLTVLEIEKVIIVENDKQPIVRGALEKFHKNRLKYIFVELTETEGWVKPRILNSALPWIDTPLTCIWDTDVVVPKAQVDAAAQAIMESHMDLSVPYTDFYHVKRRVLRTVQTNTIDYEGIVANPDNILARFETIGAGCFLCSTTLLRHVRGLNELFIGWGYEDDEIITRLCRLGYRAMRVKGPMLHIAHERLTNSWPNDDFIELSKAEWKRIRFMPPEEIARYFGITKEPGEYCSLRKPHEWTDGPLDVHCNTDIYPEPEY